MGLFSFRLCQIVTFVPQSQTDKSPNRHSLRFLSISLLPAIAKREKTPWSSDPRFELGLALQQADTLPTEPRHTHLSYATPFWAAPHPIELRCTLLSYDTPYWALPPLTELRRALTELQRTLLSYAWYSYLIDWSRFLAFVVKFSETVTVNIIHDLP